MKKIICLIIILTLTGCSTRSISNSGYDGGGYSRSNSNPLYRGELSEFNVLGIDTEADISEEQIAQAFNSAEDKVKIKRGDSVLLIQSGATIPDQEMVENLERYYDVSIFTGVPEHGKNDNVNYSRSLRFAAAKAGIETILVYWGVLESGSENLATKTVSWVPIVGWSLPDEAQNMRIRLKVAVINARTGQWEIFSPKSFNDKQYSSIVSREGVDQSQVAKLKSAGYQATVETLVQRYAN